MREIKEIISTPINSIFIILAIMISLISIDMVNQILYAGYCKYSSERIFNNDHISIELNNGENIKKDLIEDFNLEYITNKISINMPIPGGFKNISLYGMNNYSDMNEIKYLKTVNQIYFSKDDYSSGKKVAIIGAKNIDLTYDKDGKKYIDVDGVGYEVIDYLKDDKTHWEHSIIIPIKSLDNTIFNSIATINFNTKKFNENFLNETQNRFKNAKIIYNKIPLSDTIQKMKDYLMKDIKSIVSGLIIGIITCILACKFWLKEIVRKIAIKIVLGAKWRHIIEEIFLKLSLLAIPSFLCSVISSYYIGNQINNKLFTFISNNIWISLVSFVIILWIILFLSILSIYKLKKINIIDYLR